MGKKRKRKTEEDAGPQVTKRPQTGVALPDDIFHYSSIAQVSQDTQRYWHQRHKIFSRYDDGIWMTEDAWYGVTHEAVATKIASHLAETVPTGRSILLDAFAGVGGNAIAFALSGHWKRVYAIEKDPATLECARHNAKIYGVEEMITWFQGDCFELLGLDGGESGKEVTALKSVIENFGVIFASPPWGGPGYITSEVFDLNRMEPYSLNSVFGRFKQITKNMAFYLPRTSDLRQIAACVEDGQRAQVIHYCTGGRSRAICVYFNMSN